MITKREASIITTYTGFLIGNFTEAHKYMEELMERPVFTHELANKEFTEKLKEKAHHDFVNIQIENKI